MKIALCHDAVIPPSRYGGTERVVYSLARALARLGHEVFLLARPGSEVPGVEVICCASSSEWRRRHPSEAEILHLQGTPAALPPRPFVVTIHGNGKPGERFHRNTIFVSRKHAENHGCPNFVHNGMDCSEYFSEAARGDYLVFLAKASWSVKNLRGAIEVARAAGLRLEVMGSRDWPWGLHRALPAWRGVRYRGMVGDEEKRRVLGRARGLVFPVRWHEPFGMAVVEALASGCPVFATPYGSLPEIVTPEVGFLAAGSEELLWAVRGNRFSPAACRARAESAFDDLSMARNYLGYYEKVLSQGFLAPVAPVARFERSPEALLPYSYISERGRT